MQYLWLTPIRLLAVDTEWKKKGCWWKRCFMCHTTVHHGAFIHQLINETLKTVWTVFVLAPTCKYLPSLMFTCHKQDHYTYVMSNGFMQSDACMMELSRSHISANIGTRGTKTTTTHHGQHKDTQYKTNCGRCFCIWAVRHIWLHQYKGPASEMNKDGGLNIKYS